MKSRIGWFAVGVVLLPAVWAASASCSSSGSSDGGTGAGAAATTATTGSGDAGSLYECTVPSTPPSGGSCVAVPDAGALNDAGTGIQCNPVTNAGCTGTTACDHNDDDSGNTLGFICYSGLNDSAVCGVCDNQSGPFCKGGLTCSGAAGSDGSACARYCCTDADCGTGKCTTGSTSGSTFFGPLAPSLGLCTSK